jgi:hypothetical protein
MLVLISMLHSAILETEPRLLNRSTYGLSCTIPKINRINVVSSLGDLLTLCAMVSSNIAAYGEALSHQPQLIQSIIYLTVCFKTIHPSTSCRRKIMINGNSKTCEREVRVKIPNVLLKILCILGNNRRNSTSNSGIYMLTFPFLQQKADPSPGNLFACRIRSF